MRHPLSSAALSIGALLVLSVSPMSAAAPSPGSSPAVSDGPGRPLEGTLWHLTDLRLSGAYAPVPAGANATLTLMDGQASGSGGCNQYSAPYTLDGDSLTFGTLISTLILCEGAPGLVETYYFADLPAVAGWAIEGDVLTLSADDGQPVVAFTSQASPALVGKWLVTSYTDSTGAAAPVVDGSVTLLFDATSVSGTGGCNTLHGPWTLTDATPAIGPLAATEVA